VVLRFSTSGPDPAHVAVFEFAGPFTCDHGVIRARLDGVRSENGPRVLGGAVEGLYQPRLVPHELIAAWTAEYIDRDGHRATLTGYLAGAAGDDVAPRPVNSSAQSQ